MFDISARFPVPDTYERRLKIYRQLINIAALVSLLLVMLPLAVTMLALGWNWMFFTGGVMLSMSFTPKIDKWLFEATYQSIYKTPLKP